MEEDDGVAGGEDLHLEVVVPEDVQAVMNAAEDGDAQALSTALGHSPFYRHFLVQSVRSCALCSHELDLHSAALAFPGGNSVQIFANLQKDSSI